MGKDDDLFDLFDEGKTPYIPVVLIDDNPMIVGYGVEQIDLVNEYLVKRI